MVVTQRVVDGLAELSQCSTGTGYEFEQLMERPMSGGKSRELGDHLHLSGGKPLGSIGIHNVGLRFPQKRSRFCPSGCVFEGLHWVIHGTGKD